MKLGLFADSHYCNKEYISNRRPKLSYKKIQQAMEHFKQNDVDLVICLGDLVDDCESKKENVMEITRLCNMIYSYGIPFYSLMGNHDYQNFTREEFNLYTNGAYPPFMLEQENNTFVFLDCNYDQSERVYKTDEIDWTDANLPKEQLEKLESILKEKKNVYVFLHQNIDNTVDKCHIVKNANDIREIIRNSQAVRMIIQGHFHEGKDSVIDGVAYHTLKAMCEHEDGFFETIQID